MRMAFTRDPGPASQEHPTRKVVCCPRGTGLSSHPHEASASVVASLSRELERANTDPPGILLLDRGQRPLYANEEAVSILTFPENLGENKRLYCLLVEKINSVLPKQNGFSSSKCSLELSSGKRRYQVRVFELNSHLGNGHGLILAVLLERNNRAPLYLSGMSQQFRLTQREAEAVQLLTQGCTTRQIASRMDISPNTAKTFLRSVMLKTGASDRSGILAKILQLSKGATQSQGAN